MATPAGSQLRCDLGEANVLAGFQLLIWLEYMAAYWCLRAIVLFLSLARIRRPDISLRWRGELSRNSWRPGRDTE